MKSLTCIFALVMTAAVSMAADVKLSALPDQTTNAASTAILPIVDSGATHGITVERLGNSMTSLAGHAVTYIPDFSTNFVTAGTSNFVGIATNGTYQFLLMTNDIVIQSQGTGAYSLELDSNGTNRVVSIPTNYFNISTNGLTPSGTNWQVTIAAGKRAWYSEVARLPNDTNRAWAITVQP